MYLSTVHWSAVLLLCFRTGLVCCQPLVNRANVVDFTSDLKRQYDYVIIGGGTSGLTVANRLTEDPSGKLPEAIWSRSLRIW